MYEDYCLIIDFIEKKFVFNLSKNKIKNKQSEVRFILKISAIWA